jgi:two-component system nitrogen regulation response regulator GlnG/two-component system response regulator HydG
LLLEHTAVFVIEARPRGLPWLQHHPKVSFAFGAADAHGLVGESAPMWRLRDELAAAARAESHVLLLGETGAGKEVAARAVHGLSTRGGGPLVARNAATIPSSLLDVELFGCARNFPNSGSPERTGLVAAADGGHLMLDEIGELGEHQQAHLLRVLDSKGSYHRLGETEARVSDFRLIAATNRDPAALKHDFLARFSGRVQVPSLNERRSDIPLLVAELLRRAAHATPALIARFLDDNDPNRPRVEARLMEALVRHHYTEHARKLWRLLQTSIKSSRQVFLELSREVAAELAQAKSGTAATDTAATDTAATARQPSERPSAGPALSAEQVAGALEAAGGSMQAAAERLGVSRYQLYRLVKSYGLVRRFDASR